MVRAEQAEIAEKERQTQSAQTKAADPAPVSTPSQATLLKPATAWPFPGTEAAKALETPTTPPTLTLGNISGRLGFSLSAEFMRTLGFEPKREKGAVLFHESDWPTICTSLIAHIAHARETQKQAA